MEPAAKNQGSHYHLSVQPERRFPVIRAALASALAGHWIANAVADPGEYARVGLEYAGEAMYPILVQTAATLLLIGALSLGAPWWRARTRPIARRPMRPLPLLILLVVFQIGFFWLMEGTERMSLEGRYEKAFEVGLFESGFVLELLIAIVSALLVVLLARFTSRFVKAFLKTRRQVESPLAGGFAPSIVEFIRPIEVLAGAGCVRAPPAELPIP